MGYKTSGSYGDYRQKFIKAYPGIPGTHPMIVQFFGRPMPGFWYQCAICGGLCARPGNSGINMGVYSMQVDHIIAFSIGGTDDLDNLQPTHAICNQNKSNQLDQIDWQKSVMMRAMNGKAPIKLHKRRKPRDQYASHRK